MKGALIDYALKNDSSIFRKESYSSLLCFRSLERMTYPKKDWRQRHCFPSYFIFSSRHQPCPPAPFRLCLSYRRSPLVFCRGLRARCSWLLIAVNDVSDCPNEPGRNAIVGGQGRLGGGLAHQRGRQREWRLAQTQEAPDKWQSVPDTRR